MKGEEEGGLPPPQKEILFAFKPERREWGISFAEEKRKEKKKGKRRSKPKYKEKERNVQVIRLLKEGKVGPSSIRMKEEAYFLRKRVDDRRRRRGDLKRGGKNACFFNSAEGKRKVDLRGANPEAREKKGKGRSQAAFSTTLAQGREKSQNPSQRAARRKGEKRRSLEQREKKKGSLTARGASLAKNKGREKKKKSFLVPFSKQLEKKKGGFNLCYHGKGLFF